jgi:hypothetical protein
MIDQTADTTTTQPKPTRTRPAPRSRPASAGRDDAVLGKLDAILEHNRALDERLQKLERGELRTVEPVPEPKSDARVAEPLYSSPFLNTLLEQTRPTPKDYGGDQEPQYNVPQRLFLKPDGTVVSLQGDSKNRAYYQEKGYRLLSKDEQRHYEQVEQPKLLRAQRRKAHLISTIRNMFRREPSLIGWREDESYDQSLSLMSIAQLEDEWEDLRARSINPGQKLPPIPRFGSDVAERDPNLKGVEIKPLGRSRETGALVEPTAAQFG